MFKNIKFWFDCNWFSGEPFCLFRVEILHISEEKDFVQIFSLKLGKFIFAFGFYC
jgi:hypothetical protein